MRVAFNALTMSGYYIGITVEFKNKAEYQKYLCDLPGSFYDDLQGRLPMQKEDFMPDMYHRVENRDANWERETFVDDVMFPEEIGYIQHKGAISLATIFSEAYQRKKRAKAKDGNYSRQFDEGKAMDVDSKMPDFALPFNIQFESFLQFKIALLQRVKNRSWLNNEPKGIRVIRSDGSLSENLVKPIGILEAWNEKRSAFKFAINNDLAEKEYDKIYKLHKRKRAMLEIQEGKKSKSKNWEPGL